MATSTLNGKPDAGNPHVRFDEGEVASAKPRRGSLLYSKLGQFAAACVAVVVGLGLTDIAKADQVVPRSEDGVITLLETDVVHSFTNAGVYTFTPTANLSARVLVVGGGGAGGGCLGGGGGGGQVVERVVNFVANTTYTITVGAGGDPWNGTTPAADYKYWLAGGSGQASSIDGIVSAQGGGGGGAWNAGVGKDGANGGGGSNGKDGGKSTVAGGFAGGSSSSKGIGGGGGGAGGKGEDSSQTKAGDGGAGVTNDISGVGMVYAAGGGGGGGVNGVNAPGKGGDHAGNGAAGYSNNPGYPAEDGYGAGGGGGSHGGGYVGGAGGCGAVIIRYTSFIGQGVFKVSSDASIPVEASPAFGTSSGVQIGEEFACTLADYQYETADSRFVCTGWDLYSIDMTTEAKTLVKSSATSADPLDSVTSCHYVHTGMAELVWRWGASFLCEVTAGEGGSVSGGDWYAEGETITLTATPADGFQFVCWEGDVPEEERRNATAVFTAGRSKVVATAVFDYVGTIVWVNAAATPTAPYDMPEIGFTSLTDAVTYLKGLETDEAKIVKVKDGTYADAGVVLDFAVTVLGVCDEGKTALVKNTSGTTLTVNHGDAIVKDLTFQGGENNGVTLQTGIVERCTFKNWTKAATGILIVNGGEARGCLFTGNYATGGGYAGASAYVKGGVMTNCVFRNESGMTTEVFVQNGLFTDSVITNCNTGTTSGHGNLGCNAMVINGTGTARRILVAHCGSATITHKGGGTFFGKNNRQPGIVTVAAGTLADSLIYGNNARDYPGVCVEAGGRVVNCTIGAIRSVGKNADGTGLNLLQYGGEVVNTIIYGDILQPDAGYAKTGGTVSHSLFMNAARDDGTSGNIVGKDPLFTDPDAGVYTLNKFSPCRDKGAVDAAVSSDALDLAYRPRVQNDVVDMGAYELEPFGPEDVDVRIERTDYSVNDDYSQTTTLKATLVGGATEGFSYEWKDGDTVLGTDESVTVTTQPGIRQIGVTCRKGDVVKTDSYRIAVYPKTMYVSPDGSGEAPYATMGTAMKTLEDVLMVMQDGGELYHEFILSNCTHAVSTELAFTRTGKIRSADGGRAKIDLKSGAGFFRVGSDVTFENIDFVNGKTAIAISAGKMLGCTLKGTNIDGGMTGLKISGTAVIDGITISDYAGGWSNQKSVHQTGGELRNAKIINCGYVDSALTVDDGICSNLVITGTWHNHGYDYRLPSNALTINKGLVTHAVITNNGDNVRIYQGTVRVLGGTLRNALVADNKCPDTAGVYVSGQGRVENCTVIANREAGKNAQGDALWQVGGTVVNSAFFSSFAADDQPGAVQAGGEMSYSRTDEPIEGEHNTTDPVRFVTLDGWAYVPSGKPLVSGGVWLDWMNGATDLRGQPRLFGAKPDIGCFESPFEPGLKVLLK